MSTAQIVLIEDNPGDVLLVKTALTEAGIQYSLTHFGVGADAVQVLCSGSSPVPDAILLDLNTPRTDGFEALGTLKVTPRLADVPIAVLTSSRARRDKQRATVMGVRYIEKPSQLIDFLTVVGQAVKEMLQV